MATRAATMTITSDKRGKVVWENLVGSPDDGASVALPANAVHVTVQALGSFNSSVHEMQGSNDGGTTWFTLQDAFGTDISFNAAGYVQVGDNVDFHLAFHTRV